VETMGQQMAEELVGMWVMQLARAWVLQSKTL